MNDTMMGCFKTERGIEITRRVMRLPNEGNVDDMFICGLSDGCARYQWNACKAEKLHM